MTRENHDQAFAPHSMETNHSFGNSNKYNNVELSEFERNEHLSEGSEISKFERNEHLIEDSEKMHCQESLTFIDPKDENSLYMMPTNAEPINSIQNEALNQLSYTSSFSVMSTECPFRPQPLSWEMARMNFISDLNASHSNNEINDEKKSRKVGVKFPQSISYIRKRIDLWLALCLSISLFFLGLVSHLYRINEIEKIRLEIKKNHSINSDFDLFVTNTSDHCDLHIEQMLSGLIAIFCSLLSIAMSWKRNKIAKANQNSGLKASIKSFTSYLQHMSSTLNLDEHGGIQRQMESSHRPKFTKTKKYTDDCKIQLSGGTSLTDIYPVYRRKLKTTSEREKKYGKSESEIEAEWHRIPKLLLVKGDYIALQVGDTAPARVELVSDSIEQGSKTLVIEGGERITSEIMQKIAQNKRHSRTNMKKNYRTVLDEESTQLLAFNNGMKLFVLSETPLCVFLRRAQKLDNKTPQIHRQIEEVRRCLLFCSTITFISVGISIAVRVSMKQIYEISAILHLPILAALCIQPMNSFFIFLFESIGTARILTFIHPFTSQHSVENYDPQSPKDRRRFFFKYVFSTLQFRFFSTNYHSSSTSAVTFSSASESPLLPIPPTNSYFLEKLGVVTALTLIDDELACEPHSTPQQLLIPSENGLKLLDLYPTYDGENDADDIASDVPYQQNSQSKPKRGLSFGSAEHDYDSDDSDLEYQGAPTSAVSNARKNFLAFKRRRKKSSDSMTTLMGLRQLLSGKEMEANLEVQFEDPSWWKFLPSLKCIGLACLLVDFNPKRKKKNDNQATNYEKDSKNNHISLKGKAPTTDFKSTANEKISLALLKKGSSFRNHHSNEKQAVIVNANKSLVRHICTDQSRSQFLALAQCIGFSDDQKTGDLTSFKERRRLHILSTQSMQNRMALDSHALGLEESRLWGVLRPDSTSVIIQDKRSKAYQLLTVGDAQTVTALCADAWQGENATISPLNAVDRKQILDTCNSWSLADLDVAAFAYAPVPYTLEHLEQNVGGVSGKVGLEMKNTVYLVDHLSKSDSLSYSSKTITSSDWSLISNQIFLGMLGSSVSPRKEIAPIIEQCTSAGVRFVYFSPRNMRRTKELASQMGIDVAWNCAISLRALDDGEEDPHRMKSNYADWDVNARLPHGIENVNKHLEEVDNVPLLVSLYTDVTETTTTEMVDIFRKYHDTVITLGLSHRSRNERTFSASDLSIGVDVLSQEIHRYLDEQTFDSTNDQIETNISTESILPAEIEFVSSIVSHSCLFNLRGCSTMAFLPKILFHAREAFEATTAAGLFMIHGGLALSFLVFFSSFTISTHLPYVSPVGAMLYLLFILPVSAIFIALSDTDSESITRVPQKNDDTQRFGASKEFRRLWSLALLRAIPPALFAQLTHYISFSALISVFESDFLERLCIESPTMSKKLSTFQIFQCDALANYRGIASRSAGSLMVAQMAICVVFDSIGFFHRTHSIRDSSWFNYQLWIVGMSTNLFLIALLLSVNVEKEVFEALPWYFYVCFFISPLACLGIGEWIKRNDHKQFKRDAAIRRLKFETRLGMWSPK